MLHLENVTQVYRPGDRPALDDVSLQIRPGELVALLGPSGAGKSTLIRCANGLVRPTSGTVRVDGQAVTGLRGARLQAVRRQVAMIFQEFHLIDRLSVLTNVASGRLGRYPFWRAALGLFSATDLAAGRQMLARVGLEGYDKALARELSGGQRQRVAIARAMMQAPRILLGDEPVASLDPVTGRSIMQLVAELTAEQGLTTVLSLHDVPLARKFCERAVGVRQGRIVYDGPMSSVSDAVIREIYGETPAGRNLESAEAGDRTSTEFALSRGCGPRLPASAGERPCR